MLPDEKAVWDRFMSRFTEYFDSVDYDFRVGDGSPLDPSWDEGTQLTVTALTQKRIDVLGWRDESPTIIEVKGRVGLSALGQVFGYRDLFMRDFPLILEPPLMVVCARIFPDDEFILRKNGIRVVVV